MYNKVELTGNGIRKMNITKYIKERIIEDYGSIRRFAKKIGMPTSTLNTALNKERGFNNMPVENALKVCDGLGIQVEDLYNNNVEPLTGTENRLVDIYRSVSEPAKELIISQAESVKKYDTEILETEKEQEEVTDIEEKPEGYYDDFPLLAAHGTEGMTKEELDEVMDMARDARVLLRKKKAEMEND